MRVSRLCNARISPANPAAALSMHACMHTACGITGSIVDWRHVRLAGNAALLPADAVWEIESWLEWEERQLRSAACRGEGPQLHAALRKLESAVSNRAYLVGEAVSLADLAVFTTLLPLLRSQQVQPCAAMEVDCTCEKLQWQCTGKTLAGAGLTGRRRC